MMKMDERDRAECQNWEIKGHKGHFFGKFKSLEDKIKYMACLLHLN